MYSILNIKKDTMSKINNNKIEYKNQIKEYLKYHNLNKNVIRISDGKIGQLKVQEKQGYLLGRIAFYPLKKNGQVSRKPIGFIDENNILLNYKSLIEDK